MSVYFITLIEGILTFISPCILPIIPVYISFLSSGVGKDKRKIMLNSLGFVFGFSFVFILLGISATTLGRFFIKYSKYYNMVAGAVIILFGLNFSGLINIAFLNKTLKPNLNNDISKKTTIFTAFLFGSVFGVGWTPCVGAFLGTALLLSANSKTVLQGVSYLFVYSLGLAIPFLMSALLINELQGTFTFIKKHYKVINLISGYFLIIVGLLMMFGYFERVIMLLAR